MPMSRSEAGKLGAAKSKIICQQKKQQRIEKYYLSPKKCPQCETIIPFEKKSENKFCSSSCSAKYNNLRRKLRAIEKLPRAIEKLPRYLKIYYCKACGAIHKSHNNAMKCSCGLSKKYQTFKGLQKYFGLILDNLKTINFLEDFDKCRENAIELYSMNSLPSLAKLIGHPDASGGNVGKLLSYLNIDIDSRSNSQIKSQEQGRRAISSARRSLYKCGWYHFGEKSYFFRSSYEEKLMLDLISNGVDFEMEKRMSYFDSKSRKKRNCYPDFTLQNGIIIEVKSLYTFDERNMIDKFKSYTEQGYTPLLQLDFEYYYVEGKKFMKLPKDFNLFENLEAPRGYDPRSRHYK